MTQVKKGSNIPKVEDVKEQKEGKVVALNNAITIDELRKRNAELNELFKLLEKVQETSEQVGSFKVAAPENQVTIRISDSSGNVFSTNSSHTSVPLVDMLEQIVTDARIRTEERIYQVSA